MKRILTVLLIIMLVLSLCACGPVAVDDGRLHVVTTVFPLYDWTREILGSADAELTLLLDKGVDLHSYQPTAEDIVKLSSCDVFIYIGGESDEWVDDALKQATNPDMIVVKLMDCLGDALVEEETVEGMQAEEEEEEAFDEHVWLSLRNAQTCCEAICDALCQADEANADTYKDNAYLYGKKLEELDGRYNAYVDIARFKTLLVADRFPFRYLAEDYHLRYYAAFSGCSAESEASFETVSFLAGKLSELNLPAVVILDGSDGKIAETVIQTAGVEVGTVRLDSMQSVTAADLAETSYLAVMEQNLDALTTALGG